MVDRVAVRSSQAIAGFAAGALGRGDRDAAASQGGGTAAAARAREGDKAAEALVPQVSVARLISAYTAIAGTQPGAPSPRAPPGAAGGEGGEASAVVAARREMEAAMKEIDRELARLEGPAGRGGGAEGGLQDAGGRAGSGGGSLPGPEALATPRPSGTPPRPGSEGSPRTPPPLPTPSAPSARKFTKYPTFKFSPVGVLEAAEVESQGSVSPESTPAAAGSTPAQVSPVRAPLGVSRGEAKELADHIRRLLAESGQLDYDAGGGQGRNLGFLRHRGWGRRVVNAVAMGVGALGVFAISHFSKIRARRRKYRTGGYRYDENKYHADVMCNIYGVGCKVDDDEFLEGDELERYWGYDSELEEY